MQENAMTIVIMIRNDTDSDNKIKIFYLMSAKGARRHYSLKDLTSLHARFIITAIISHVHACSQHKINTHQCTNNLDNRNGIQTNFHAIIQTKSLCNSRLNH